MPSAVDLVLNDRVAGAWRAKVCRDVRGDVCEFGFGTGANMRFYGPEVTHVWAVEPSSSAKERYLAARAKSGGSWAEVTWASEDAADVSSLPDGSVDAVVSTWAMCSIPDIGRALSEAKRILRPGGVLSFVEHGLSPSRRLATIQNRLQPAWGAVSGGCHLNRDMVALVNEAGFELTLHETAHVAGWFWPARPWSYFTHGRAVPMS